MWYRGPVQDGERLALLALGYKRIFYAELYCPTNGAIRIGVELEPSRRHPCPVCGRRCSCSGVLCMGYSRRELPFFEVVAGPVISLLADDEQLMPEPAEPVAVIAPRVLTPAQARYHDPRFGNSSLFRHYVRR